MPLFAASIRAGTLNPDFILLTLYPSTRDAKGKFSVVRQLMVAAMDSKSRQRGDSIATNRDFSRVLLQCQIMLVT